jgi:hypothetical protein
LILPVLRGGLFWLPRVSLSGLNKKTAAGIFSAAVFY